MVHDAIVIGGAFAGLSAALQLGRARRSVIVVDAGKPRNRFASHSHGFLGQDGRTPTEILATARGQLAAYSTVAIAPGEATDARATLRGFEVALADGVTVEAARLILASGLIDTLPPVPGLAEEWGRSVFQCPYCDGYEVGGGPIAVLAVNRNSMHQAPLLADWGRVTFFLNGAFELTDDDRALLTKRGVTVETAKVERWSRNADGGTGVVMDGGRIVPAKALFTATRTALASPIAEQLGCALQDGPQGSYIQVDERQRTSVANVFAAGDAARPMHSVALAVAGGAMAGIAAHQSMVFDLAA
jgi:thioredoxin reductase